MKTWQRPVCHLTATWLPPVCHLTATWLPPVCHLTATWLPPVWLQTGTQLKLLKSKWKTLKFLSLSLSSFLSFRFILKKSKQQHLHIIQWSHQIFKWSVSFLRRKAGLLINRRHTHNTTPETWIGFSDSHLACEQTYDKYTESSKCTSSLNLELWERRGDLSFFVRDTPLQGAWREDKDKWRWMNCEGEN